MANVRLSTVNYAEAALSLLLNGPAVTVVGNTWASGSNVISRASGSYTTDGCKRQALLSGALAAKFPATTRIATVGTTTMTMTQNANSAFTTPQDGTFTPLSLAYGDVGMPMTNIANGQRYTPWDTGAVLTYPATIAIEWDLQAAQSTSVFALLGLTWNVNGAGVTQARISSASTYGTWTLRGTTPSPAVWDRDVGVAFTPVSARYWQVLIDVDVRTVMGGVYFGPIDADLGASVAPGSTRSVSLPVARQQTPSGIPIYTAMGSYPATRFAYGWSALPKATRQLVEAAHKNRSVLAVTRRVPVLIDEDNKFYEVDFVDRAFGWTTRFVNVDAFTLELESLP